MAAEALEVRLPLDASGFDGNDCAPDLDLSAISTQSVLQDQELVLDLAAIGGTATDVDDSGSPTGDNIIWQLDPDDNPAGATMDENGVFRWTSSSTGSFEFIVIAIDDGDPALADAETFTVVVNEDPALTNDTPDLAEVAEQQATVGTELSVALSATDPEDDNLIFQIDPDELDLLGATLEADGNTATLRWTPTEAFLGQTVELTVLVVDDGVPPKSDSEKITIQVSGVVAASDSYDATTSNGVISVDADNGVLSNDTSTNAGDITVAVVDPPQNGTVTLEADGSFSYTATDAFRGIDTFTYQATDAAGDTAIGTVSIVVNARPDGAADSYSVDEDNVLSVAAAEGVLINDTDGDDDALTADMASNPANGTVQLNADGSFDYTPAANFAGEDSFTYVVSDGILTSEAVVTITVNAVNDAPIARDDAYSTVEETELGVSIAEGVGANDEDVEGSALVFTLVDDVDNGLLVFPPDGSISYTPDANFSGTDTFTYTASDGELTSEVATVTFTVGNTNDVPTANADSYDTDEDSVLEVIAGVGVLFNDLDSDNDALTATLVDLPTNGIVELDASGSLTYTPAANFNGVDTFTYTVSDGTDTSEAATVTITVNPVNDAPVVADSTYETAEDSELAVSIADGVSTDASDAEGSSVSFTLVKDVDNGTLTFEADGSFTYTPSADFNGTDTFSVTASDGELSSAEATVTINVTAVNDAPLANPDAYETDEGTPLTVVIADGVLANDTDIDNDTLTASRDAPTANGTVELNPDGSFTYTPNANFNGNDQFTYRANDGTENSPLVGFVSITVNPVNQAPTGVTRTFDATEDTQLVVDAAEGLLRDASDSDGDTLTVSIATGPTEGEISLNEQDGSFEYDASQDSSGTDQFTYTISDGTLTSDPVTVQINVTTSNDAPEATDDTYEVSHNTELIVAAPGVIENDSDLDDTALNVSIVQNVGDGSLTLNADGSFNYTPTTGFSGTTTFTYEVSDGEATDTGTVTLNVAEANSFVVAAAAPVDTVIGSVASASATSPVFYQFEDANIDQELVLRPNDHLAGEVDAPVVLVEYLDFACAACAAWHPNLQDIKQNLEGDVLVVSRHLPLQTNSLAAAKVSEAAAQQGKFDEMADLLFANQDDWRNPVPNDPSSFFNTYAAQLSLVISQYTADIVDADLEQRITDDASDASDLGATGTPTFYLDGELVSPGTGTELEGLINAEVADAGSFKINRLTGEILVANNSDIANQTLTVLATHPDGTTETIDVTINAQQS